VNEMGLNLGAIKEITGTSVESTEEMTWSVGRKKTLETMKSDWVKLIKVEIKKVNLGKSRMVRWSNDNWEIRLLKGTEALRLSNGVVLKVNDKSNSNEVIVKVLNEMIEQIKKGNLNKEIQQHMDKCRDKRNKYK
jgi:hypothetical protein